MAGIHASGGRLWGWMTCATRRSAFCGPAGAAPAARAGPRARGMSSPVRAMPVVRTSVGKIVVIGGGALGSLFSGRLAALKELDERVWMLTNWVEHATLVNKMGGLVVRESDAVGGGCLVGNVQVTNDFRTILNERTPDEDKMIYNVNVVIVAVKHRSIRRAAEEAAKLLSRSHGGLCISVLNGVGHMQVLKDALKYHDTKASLIHGVFNGGAAIECPGVVVHTGKGSTQLGEDPTADLMSRNFLHDVAALLSRAGLSAQLRSDVNAVVWQKLAVNAAINPLTAILRVKNGALPLSPSCVELMEGAAREAHAVGCKVLEEGMGKEAAAQTQLVREGWMACSDRALEVANATAANTSSMLSDTLKGEVTEIEAISGAVVREGLKHGVDTPINRALLNLVKAAHEMKDITGFSI